MRNPGRLLAETSPHVKRLALKVGIGATLSLGTLALAHMMPADRLDSPVKTISAAEAPSFDFLPAKPGADVAGPNLPADTAKVESAQSVAVASTPKAPLPASRRQVVLASAKASEAITYPAGVERFDKCQARCESRDPAVFGTPQPMIPAQTAAAVPPPPIETRGPLQTAFHGAVDGAMSGAKATVDGAVNGAKSVIGGGRRMLDGAVGTAGETLSSVKEAMLGAITPDL